MTKANVTEANLTKANVTEANINNNKCNLARLNCALNYTQNVCQFKRQSKSKSVCCKTSTEI